MIPGEVPIPITEAIKEVHSLVNLALRPEEHRAPTPEEHQATLDAISAARSFDSMEEMPRSEEFAQEVEASPSVLNLQDIRMCIFSKSAHVF